MDVADNLGRASSVVKESFSKIDAKDGDGAVPLLRTLLEGVDMTEKQLVEVGFSFFSRGFMTKQPNCTYSRLLCDLSKMSATCQYLRRQRRREPFHLYSIISSC